MTAHEHVMITPNQSSVPVHVSTCHGILLPEWPMDAHISLGEIIGRAAVCFVCFLYMLLGTSLITDRFIEAIEVRLLVG
jgi:hypothetical protein